MSEYDYVEKPFLNQLAALGWQVIDQGSGIPQNPAKSHRSRFREVILKDIFRDSVRAINTLDDGQPWLTAKQLDDLLDPITQQPGNSLLEANEAILKLLYRTQVDVNEVTGEEYPNVQLIDFHQPERNHFLAINQFRVDTPGAGKDFIIPDIVLCVNGLPLVVVECKDVNLFTANPMYEAFKQLMRYSDQRHETQAAGLREGEPRLFHTNQLMIRTCGDQADVGTITSTEEEYFFPWKNVCPDTQRAYEPPLGKERQQEVLIQGLLPKDTLLDIVRNCILFMDVSKARAKIVSRYQQYRAMGKIIQRLRSGRTPEERSGVIWHTQGSGKSLSMVFVIRKLRMCDDLKDFKVCLINDRRDLEKQLSETARLTGETVTLISSTEQLKTRLASPTSNLNMVMVHKFHEHQTRNLPDYVESVLEVPTFGTFGVINPSERILLMIDEAHRSQSGDLGDNLFAAFPNATRLAFTGTPLIVVHDRQQTTQRFGHYIDKYKLQDAVDDGATVQILYEGKTAETAITHKAEFDSQVEEHAAEYVTSQLRKTENVEALKRIAQTEQRSFDDLVREHTAEEILALKRKWGTTGDILEAEQRIQAIATDLVGHYIDNILPNGFKAQVVCHAKMAAVHYKTYVDQALQARLAAEQGKPAWSGAPHELPEDDRHLYRDDDLCRKIAFLKSVVVVSSEGTNERAVITQARKHARDVDAVENFKRPFDYDDPGKTHTGIAFLIVCDMLLTGFDAPIEQVMYIDKKVKDHNLLQTIARVNRVAKGKTRGYIVDYIGLAQHLKEALSIYAAEDQADIQETLKDIGGELPVLESRYQRLLHLFHEHGVAEIAGFVLPTLTEPLQTFATLEQAIEAMADLKLRATFEVYLKQFMQSLDIVLPHAAANPYKIPVKRFGYLLTKVKERYKDDSLNLSGAGEKVKQLINAHLISLGIDPKIPPVELLSDHFIAQIEQNVSPKAKASEMEHAMRKHCTIHFDEDPAFYARLSEKLEALIQKHHDEWEQLCLFLLDLRHEAESGRQDEIAGVSAQAAPFYDLVGQIAFGPSGVPAKHADGVKALVAEVIDALQRTIDIIDFWRNPPAINQLKGQLSDVLLFTGIDAIIDHSDQIVTEMTALAKVRHQDLVG